MNKFLKISAVVVGLIIIGIFVFKFYQSDLSTLPTEDSNKEVMGDKNDICYTNPEFCKNVSFLYEFKPLPLMSLLKPGEYFSQSDKICTHETDGKKQECVSKPKREISLSTNLKAVLQYNSSSSHVSMWFYNKNTPLVIPSGHTDFFDGFYFVDEKNIIVLMPEDEAPQSVFYYNGINWQYLPHLIGASIQKFYSPDYYLDNVLPMAEFSINKDLILKVKEPNSEQYIGTSGPYQVNPTIEPTAEQKKDNTRHRTVGYYTFFIDLKNQKLIGVYLTHDDQNTKQSHTYNFKDATLKYPVLTN